MREEDDSRKAEIQMTSISKTRTYSPLLHNKYLIHARKFPPMASCVLVDHHCQWLPSVLSVKMVQVRYHRTANHLSVLDHVGIGSIDPFASVTRPTIASLKLVTVIPSQILLRIPQTRFRLSGSQEWPPIILAYTTKVLILD